MLKIGIVVYSAISVSMAVVGGSRSINPTNISRTSKIYGAVGAILLVVSDGMYMLQKYDKQLPHYEMLWAITYYSGLSFLGATAWKKVNRPESKLAPMECDVIAPTLQQSIPINSKSLIVEAGAVGEKHNVAICFSGGGQRAYATALGIMNALMKNDRGVNYLQKFRYMTGVEGGSWATVAAAYSPHQDDMAGFIGNYVSPNSMTVGYMKGVSKEGAYDNRSLRSHGTISSLYYYAIRCVFAPAANMGNKWAYAASTTYLPHLGDKVTKNFTCNVETANELIKCNPQLALDDFVWPNNEDFAFPIVQCALDRPSGYAYARRPDESFKQRDLSNIEISPAYIGNLVVRNALYFGNQTHVTGGMIRPYEFTIKAPISATKDRSMLCFETNTINSTPYMNLRRAIGLSSYAPGLLVDNARSRLPIVQHFRDTFESFPMFYWSPSSYPKPVSREYLFCDGGILENVMLIAMLQRKVKHIVLCFGKRVHLYIQAFFFFSWLLLIFFWYMLRDQDSTF